MTPRNRAIVVVALGALLIAIIIAAILLFLRLRKPAAVTPTPTPIVNLPESNPAPAPFQDPLNPNPPAAPAPRTAATQLAELFAERYGSFSNQGSYQNLRDLLPVMTDRLQASTRVTLASATTTPSTVYTGTTSLKLKTEVREYDENAGTATIAVTLKQDKLGVGTTAVTSYRSLKMTLKKIGQDWKVDTAEWES